MNVLLTTVCFSMFFGVYLTFEHRLMFLPINSEILEIPTCPKNEIYKFCLNNCSNCEQRGKCIAFECTARGCDCMAHFVRLVPDGPCVTVNQCPKPDKCGDNEVFRDCASSCEYCYISHCRALDCSRKCYCKNGYRRNIGGECIPEEQCPIKTMCGFNEEMKASGLEEEFCLHSELEAGSNSTVNQIRCYCKEGCKRNVFGYCVQEEICLDTCMENAVYQSCPRACNSTCWNYGDLDCVEDDQCYPGCFCVDGYVMDDNKQCVQPHQCPPGSNAFAPAAPPETNVTIPSSNVSTDEGDTDSITDSATEDNSSNTTEADSDLLEETEVESKNDKEEEETGDNLPDEDVSTGYATAPTEKPASNKNQPRIEKTEANSKSAALEDKNLDENE